MKSNRLEIREQGIGAVIRSCEILKGLFPVTEGRQEAAVDRKAVTPSI